MTPAERSQRISDVCELAAQLRPEEREAFLAGQCQGDDDLLRDVKSALPGYLPFGKSDSGAVAVAASPPPMKRIGRYEITGTIGSGGSGQVYSALDRAVGRVVAIKVLNAPGDPDLVRRFEAEAKTVANLHHKNIVTVHEYGEENGVPYLVMEYLKGTTLQELIRLDSLSLLEKVEIMSEVAEGLQYAHECGITHRDVKPANIMQLTDGAVKIMDFGIARLGAEGATRLTQTGLLIGSIMYMAPEQFGGTADAQTDVFAYGVTFYELLTGVNPYSAPDPVGIIFKIANSDPPPVRGAVPECPVALERILSRTMARDREARYSSLLDVLADTSGILAEMRRDQAYKFFQEADQLYNAGQLDAAKMAVRKVLRLDPGQEDARHLRAEIDETLRRRDALARAESLMGQAEAAVGAQQFEEAGAHLDAIRELGVSNPKLQGRIDWATAQVERARQRDRVLYQAQRDLRNANFTEAFRAVSEVLAEDPGNGPGKDLLQEIRKQMAASDAARRFREAIAEVNRLVANRQVDEALARLDQLAADYPDARSPENQEIRALRAAATAQAADGRRERIAALASQAEGLLARQEFDLALAVLEAGIGELGDDWDLTRLLLQAKVAQNTAREQAEVREQSQAEERQKMAQLEMTESAPATAEVDHWRQALAKLDATLGPAPASPSRMELNAAVAARSPEQRERAIQEALGKLEWLQAAGHNAEAARVLDQCLRENGTDARLIQAQQRLSGAVDRQLPTEVLDRSQFALSQAPREVPLRPRRNRAAIWIVAAVVALAALAAGLWLARPQLTILLAKLHRTPVSKLAIDQPSGSKTVARGSDYALDLHASGGSPPISWSVREGSLPRGLAIDPSTGRISGVPDTSGIFSFLVHSADRAGLSAQRALTIEVVEPPDSSGQPGAGAAAQNVATCTSNAFTLSQYGDLLTGELIWNGDLGDGSRLEIVNRRASFGSVQGEIFPRGVPIRIFVSSPRILVVTAPSAQNCWDPRLVLENLGNAKSQVRIQWEVIQQP